MQNLPQTIGCYGRLPGCCYMVAKVAYRPKSKVPTLPFVPLTNITNNYNKDRYFTNNTDILDFSFDSEQTNLDPAYGAP